MPGPGLPVNTDSTYADDGTDATVKLHQQHHDVLHGFADEFDTATRSAGAVFVHNGTLFVPRALVSSDVPTTAFETTAGGNYTFVLADAGKLKGSTTGDSAAITWTYPTFAAVPLPVGTTIKVIQRGLGQITVSGTGINFIYAGTGSKTSQQGGTMLLTKLFTDTLLVEGGIN